MNKNYKEQYLKVKDIKDEQCDCVCENLLCELVSYVSSHGYNLRIVNTNDTFTSSQTHLDTHKLLIFNDRVQIRFRCGEQAVTNISPNTIIVHCGKLGETYYGVRKQIGTLQGMNQFIEILSKLQVAV
jgi:hypothetical protein